MTRCLRMLLGTLERWRGLPLARWLPRSRGAASGGARAASLPLLALVQALALLAPSPRPAAGQEGTEAWRELLRAVLPAAERFVERAGDPPVFRAYRSEPGGEDVLVGYAFLTSDVPPEQMGFDGPIEVLVGMGLDGRLTGIRVIDYVESLRRSRGDFLARPGFQEHFTGKSIADAFQVRRDVDGITGATITVDAMSRGIRNAARRVAIAHGLGAASPLAPASLTARAEPPHPLTISLEELARLSWSEMVLGGPVVQMLVLEDGRIAAELSLLPMRDDAVAELLLGPQLLTEVRERAGERYGSRHRVLVGADGPLAGALNLSRLAVVQEGDTTALGSQDVLLFGAPRAGKLDGQVRFVRILLLERTVDLERPFTYVLDLRPGLAVYTAEHAGRPTAPPLAPGGGPGGARGALPAPGDPAAPAATAQLDPVAFTFQEEAEETLLARTLASTSWPRVGALALLLALALAAFLSKREGLRWATLGGTLVFLGFVDKGFLSVSHINSGLRVGPEVYLSDLALLLLVGFTVATTLLWGRVFCGYLCPFGVLQDLLERVVPRRLRRELPRRLHRRALQTKYVVLAVVVAPAALGSGASLFQYFEPFGTVFFPSRSLVLWAIAAGVLAACAVIPRFYCRYLCPLGAALALASLLSPFRIPRVEQCGVCKVCEQRCPTGAIAGSRLDFKECVRCNVCEIQLARRAGVCRHDMDVVRSRLVKIEVAPRPGAGG